MNHALLILSLLLAGGCQFRTNPSFDLSPQKASEELAAMRQSPRQLQRPLVILGGFTDAGWGTRLLAAQLESVLDDRRVLVVTFADCISFEQCRDRVVEAVDREFGAADGRCTVEVDVVGQSMGGLVALVACSDLLDGQRRLNVKRLFALSSPLQGARLAQNAPVVLTDMHRDMRPESVLYKRLATAPRSAEIYCYTRLRDNIVGELYAAPAGQTAWWLDSPTPIGEHWLGVFDQRVLADVARRLRGEEAYATQPAAALPRS